MAAFEADHGWKKPSQGCCAAWQTASKQRGSSHVLLPEVLLSPCGRSSVSQLGSPVDSENCPSFGSEEKRRNVLPHLSCHIAPAFPDSSATRFPCANPGGMARQAQARRTLLLLTQCTQPRALVQRTLRVQCQAIAIAIRNCSQLLRRFRVGRRRTCLFHDVRPDYQNFGHADPNFVRRYILPNCARESWCLRNTVAGAAYTVLHRRHRSLNHGRKPQHPHCGCDQRTHELFKCYKPLDTLLRLLLLL